eukprot:SAG11_NODE_7_length_31267_cov_19.541966_25_plen_98_part_00
MRTTTGPPYKTTPEYRFLEQHKSQVGPQTSSKMRTGSFFPMTRIRSSSRQTKFALTSLYVDSEMITSTPYFFVTPSRRLRGSDPQCMCRADNQPSNS